MANEKLNKAIVEDDNTYKEYTIMSCGCCSTDMISENDEMKDEDKDYCVNGPAFCTPDDGEDAWSPCDTSGKGGVKKINVCVTDLLNDNTDTFCVHPFDDIFSDSDKSIYCGKCDEDDITNNDII